MGVVSDVNNAVWRSLLMLLVGIAIPNPARLGLCGSQPQRGNQNETAKAVNGSHPLRPWSCEHNLCNQKILGWRAVQAGEMYRRSSRICPGICA